MDPSTRPGLFVLIVMIAPATLAGGVLLLGASLRRGQPLAWVGALAAGLAYLLGHFFALPAPPKFPAASSADGLYWSGGLALFCGVTIGWRARAVWSDALMAVIAACGATLYVLQRVVGRMTTSELVVIFGGVAALVAVAYVGAERTAKRSSGITPPLLLWITATAAAVCHALSGAANYATYTAVLAAILGAAIVVGFLRRDLNTSRGLAAVVLLQLAVLAVAGARFAELPLLSAALLLLSPAAAAFLGESRAQSLGEKKALLLRAAMTALPALGAVALSAYQHLQRSSSS